MKLIVSISILNTSIDHVFTWADNRRLFFPRVEASKEAEDRWVQVREDQRASRETILIFQLAVPFLRSISTCLQVDRPIFNKKKKNLFEFHDVLDRHYKFSKRKKRIYKMRDISLEINIKSKSWMKIFFHSVAVCIFLNEIICW